MRENEETIMNWLRYIIFFSGFCFIFTQDGPFMFNQSETQAFYFFYSITINEEAVSADDWVGAFNGDICVGARQWDTSQCGNNVCDVPVMGDDGSDVTEGYINSGEIPTFKIYIASEDMYYDAEVSGEVNAGNGTCVAIAPDCMEWSNMGTILIDNLSVDCVDENGTDLPTDCNGDCSGSAFLDDCNDCVGGNTGLAPGQAEDECGVCNGPGPTVGCWDGSDECDENDCPFNPDDCSTGMVGMEDYLNYINICVPSLFSTTNVSSQQAFYYFQSVIFDGASIDANDWVGAFNGDICIGARQWDTSQCGNGVCDVPVMGDDGSDGTEGYINSGEIPTFKIYIASEDMYYDVEALGTVNSGSCIAETPDCMEWYNFGSYIIESLIEVELSNSEIGYLYLDNYHISNIYPNPFNPITTITYDMPINSYVSIAVYDIAGKQIISLVDNFQTSGFHSINWNASNYPSGVYIIRLTSGKYRNARKVILIK